MKKLLAVLLLLSVVQAMAETVVKGTYESKKRRYRELTQKFIKEVNLNYALPNDKKNIVTYKTENYDILVRKQDLLELYNMDRKEKIADIKNVISYKDKKFDYVHNYIAELIENNRAAVYNRKNKKEVNHMIKIKYNNNIYYDEGRGSNYDGYVFYTDKTLTEEILRFDIITQFGVAIHSSLGDNPYNRELSQKEKEWIEKYSKNFEKMKELYKKAVANPDVEQRFSY